MPYADNNVYNIVLNSLNKASGTNADATYYYDWSVIPKGEYMMTLDYIGGANTFNSARFGVLSIDMGQSKNYTTSATSTSSFTTKIYGYLTPQNVNATNNNNIGFFLSPNDNSPTYLNSVPTNNTFTVQVQNPNGTAYTDSNGAVNADYLLIIHLLRFVPPIPDVNRTTLI